MSESTESAPRTLGPQRFKARAPKEETDTPAMPKPATFRPNKSSGEEKTANDSKNAPAEAAEGEHPLQNVWTLHYDNGSNKGEWGSNIKAIANVASVEEFWKLYNNIIRPADLWSRATFNLFKHGVRPMYEDEFNEKGGVWTIQFGKDAPQEVLNRIWLFTLLSIIGEQYDHGPQICGAVFAKKKFGPRIQMWTKQCDDLEAVKRIGAQWSEILEEKTMKFSYAKHGEKATLAKINY